MALTDDQKVEAVIYLGWPARTLTVGAAEYSKIVSDRLASLPEFGEKRVIKFLKRIRDIDDKIEEATERLSVTQVDTFKLSDKEIHGLRSVRKSYVKEIASVTNIPSCTGSSGVRVSL